MTLMLTPDLGVPISPDTNIVDLRERAAALCGTIELLEEHGLDTSPTQGDKDLAATLVEAYAANPEKTSKTVSTQRAAQLTPASLIQTRAILDEFGTAVARHAVEIRHLVTNKLLLETENPDPRVRIRALELLGKITDVGLFTDKTEVTVTHQSTDDLRKKLREKFNRLIDRTHNATDIVEIDDGVIDVHSELGLGNE
jgi:hypothetical protein